MAVEYQTHTEITFAQSSTVPEDQFTSELPAPSIVQNNKPEVIEILTFQELASIDNQPVVAGGSVGEPPLNTTQVTLQEPDENEELTERATSGEGLSPEYNIDSNKSHETVDTSPLVDLDNPVVQADLCRELTHLVMDAKINLLYTPDIWLMIPGLHTKQVEKYLVAHPEKIPEHFRLLPDVVRVIGANFEKDPIAIIKKDGLKQLKYLAKQDPQRAIALYESMMKDIEKNGKPVDTVRVEVVLPSLISQEQVRQHMSSEQLSDFIKVGSGTMSQKKLAFEELQRRNDPKIEQLVAEKPQLMVEKSSATGLYVDQLKSGDFTNFQKAFSKEESGLFFPHARKALKEVLSDPSFEIPEAFVTNMYDLNDHDFFEVVTVMTNVSRILPDSIYEEAKKRLDSILTRSPSEHIESPGNMAPFMRYLTTFNKEAGVEAVQKMQKTQAEFLKTVEFDEGGELNIGGEVNYLDYTLMGSGPAILHNPALIDGMTSETEEGKEYWSERRPYAFYSAIKTDPSQAKQIIQQFYPDGKVNLREVMGLLSSGAMLYDMDNTIVPQDLPEVKQLIAKQVLDGNIPQEAPRDAILSAVVTTINNLGRNFEFELSQLDYSYEEIPFINSQMENIAEGNTEKVQKALKTLRDAQERCSEENKRKNFQHMYSEEDEKAFWKKFALALGDIAAVSPQSVTALVDKCMNQSKGYYELKEQVPCYGKMAKVNPALFDRFMATTGQMPAKNLWNFLNTAYSESEIARLTDAELSNAQRFLQKTGNLALSEHYKLYHALGQGELPESAQSAGVTETGQVGQEQLMKHIARQKHDLLTNQNATVDPNNALQVELTSQLTRYEDAEFNSTKPLKDVLKEVKDAQQKGLLHIPPRYVNKEIYVDVIDANVGQGFTFRDESIKRFNDLQSDVKAALQPPQDILEVARQRLQVTADNQREQFQHILEKNPGDETLQARLGEIQSLADTVQNIQSEKDVIQIAATLKQLNAKNQEVDSLIRTAVLSHYAQQDERNRTRLSDLGSAAPEPELMAPITEFYEHTIGQEYLNAHEELRAKGIKPAFSAKAINLDLERFRAQQTSSGKEKVLIVPTRGVLGVNSGAISDACYPNEVATLTSNPNVIPHIIILNPDSPGEERVGGSFLVFDKVTKENSSIPVRAIAGINPLQTTINKLAPHSIVEEIITYVDDLVDKESKESPPIVVIAAQDYRGTSSNRKEIDDAIDHFHIKRHVSLDGDVKFGGLSIGKTCMNLE